MSKSKKADTPTHKSLKGITLNTTLPYLFAMRKLIILGLIGLLFLSGCPYIPDILKPPEQRALEIAETTTEAKFLARMDDAFERGQYCTADEFIDEMRDLYREQGMGEMPQITAEERAVLEQQLDDFKRCDFSIDSDVDQKEGNIYTVSYSMEYAPTCQLPSGSNTAAMRDMVIIEADVVTGEAEVVQGEMQSEDVARMEEMMEMLESSNCGVFMTFSISGSTSVSTPV